MAGYANRVTFIEVTDNTGVVCEGDSSPDGKGQLDPEVSATKTFPTQGDENMHQKEGEKGVAVTKDKDHVD